MPTIKCNEGVGALVIIMKQIKEFSINSESMEQFKQDTFDFLERQDVNACENCKLIILNVKKYCKGVFA